MSSGEVERAAVVPLMLEIGFKLASSVWVWEMRGDGAVCASY